MSAAKFFIFIYLFIFYVGARRPQLSRFHVEQVQKARLYTDRTFHFLVSLQRLAIWGLGPEPSVEAIAHELTIHRRKFSYRFLFPFSLLFLFIYFFANAFLFHFLVSLQRLATWGLGPEPSVEAIAHELTIRRRKFSYRFLFPFSLLFLFIYFLLMLFFSRNDYNERKQGQGSGR